MLLTEDDGSIDLALESRSPCPRHRALDDPRPQMLELLSLRFSSSGVIVSRLLTATRLMRWPEIVNLIRPTEFKGADMLDDPAVPHTVNAAIANHTSPARPLPSLKPAAT